MEMLCPCKNHLPADPPTPAGPKGASMVPPMVAPSVEETTALSYAKEAAPQGEWLVNPPCSYG